MRIALRQLFVISQLNVKTIPSPRNGFGREVCQIGYINFRIINTL